MAMHESRVALVTGGAGSIGRRICRRLAEAGAHVVVVDQSDRARAYAAELTADGLKAEGLVCDVSDEAAVATLAQDVKARHGKVDILVNNAGIVLRKEGTKVPALALSLEDWSRVLAVNLTGAFLFVRAFVPAMTQAGWGRVINMSSMGGRVGSRINGMHYSASKAGLIGMSRTLALEVSRAGVTVNVIAPGRILTDMNQAEGTSDQLIDTFIPAGRLGTPEEVAACAFYLASDEASYVTGAILDINGGWYMP
ncbi:SDR family oxidoreductase [Aquabacter spiritensis]|uniref:3-oxoacyl-[acyl-carrier protein] reductase n=1 Tax=Aquabacter spiritensis TaxID=933073 RepID=A0A4R3LL08_9HYPH|nr:SDR family NAD(P)-dependent oxidoreductase [Aquabacter spiritensis]TCT00601.1 3-oxoacyl-[acyl-carrier protein] reductase [Aquabacter spiritensis]